MGVELVLVLQVAEIRKMITERDELLDASSGSGGKQVGRSIVANYMEINRLESLETPCF
jgi:hypothetical protein